MRKFYNFSMFMLLLAITCVSCQKEEVVGCDLLHVFENTILQYSDDCSGSSMSLTKSGTVAGYEHLVGFSKEMPQEMKEELDHLISGTAQCESIEELKVYFQRYIVEMSNSSIIDEAVKEAYVMGMSFYFTLVKVGVADVIETKTVVSKDEREMIGQASDSKVVRSTVWGWVWGTLTGGPTGGVLGAIGALLYELS